MHQNRVNPQGQIISTLARGAWMGNRGLLHDNQKNIVRPFKLKAWLICVLEFKDRKRQIMKPDRYTELFFLMRQLLFLLGTDPVLNVEGRIMISSNPFGSKATLNIALTKKHRSGKLTR